MDTSHLKHFIKPLLIGILLALLAAWAYTGVHINEHDGQTSAWMPEVSSQSEQTNSASSTAGPYMPKIESKDDAVRAYLYEAQLHAQIYRYTNENSYAGMCELLGNDGLFTLEQGVLKYIKMVGATGVFCSTSNTAYLIEAKLPEKGDYFCIDSNGYAGEQASSHQKDRTCTSS